MRPIEYEIYRSYRSQLKFKTPDQLPKTEKVHFFELCKKYDTLFFDAWGTLYIENRALDNAVETIQRLRQRGAMVRMVTNNSSMTPDALARETSAIGFDFKPHEIISSSQLLQSEVNLLNIKEAFHLGRKNSLEIVLRSHIAPVEEPKEPVVILTSTPSPEDHQRMVDQAEKILKREGAQLLILNPDAMAPYLDGGYGETAGALGWRLANRTGCETRYSGKPFPELFQLAIDSLPSTPQNILMVGDTMGTDIVGAQMAGIDSLLLLQGNSRSADWKRDAQQLQCSPNYVTDSLAIEVV